MTLKKLSAATFAMTLSLGGFGLAGCGGSENTGSTTPAASAPAEPAGEMAEPEGEMAEPDGAGEEDEGGAEASCGGGGCGAGKCG
jgi:hypothetical protein